VKIENIAGNQLNSLGFHEIMSNSLTKANYIEHSENLKQENNVAILNPLSNDLAVMRQSLLFSGLESVSYNINRKNNLLKFFEFGKTYHKYEDKYEEFNHLALFVSGNRSKDTWTNANKTSDFFYVKGIVKSLLERLGVVNLKTSPTKNDVFSEGITLNLGKIKLADVGIIKKEILKSFGIKQEVVYVDFNWDNVLKISSNKGFKVKALAKFPSVKRDLSLLLDSSVTFGELYNLAFQSERKLLKDVDLFDVYEGNKLGANKKSYAVSFLIQDEQKTLNEKQIDKIMQKLQATFEKNLEATLR
jgi:phenylalanyl-tRNA synthetase beta chain